MTLAACLEIMPISTLYLTDLICLVDGGVEEEVAFARYLEEREERRQRERDEEAARQAAVAASRGMWRGVMEQLQGLARAGRGLFTRLWAGKAMAVQGGGDGRVPETQIVAQVRWAGEEKRVVLR